MNSTKEVLSSYPQLASHHLISYKYRALTSCATEAIAPEPYSWDLKRQSSQLKGPFWDLVFDFPVCAVNRLNWMICRGLETDFGARTNGGKSLHPANGETPFLLHKGWQYHLSQSGVRRDVCWVLGEVCAHGKHSVDRDDSDDGDYD